MCNLEVNVNIIDANELITAGHGFRMEGAFTHGGYHDDCACGERCRCPRDGVTGAKGFYDGGEAATLKSVGRNSNFDMEAELHMARLTLEDEDLAEEWDDAAELLEQLDGADGDHRSMYFSASEGLADTNELSTAYWDEVASAHVAEMRQAMELMAPRRGDAGLVPGAMEFWQSQRTQRARRLWRMAKHLRRVGNSAKLAELKKGVRERYATSVKLVVERSKREWWMLYLTKEQVATITAI